MSSSAAAAAASAKTSKEPQQTAHQPKTKYAFDVAKPMKNGFLKKPGKVTKSMKERFFVLYPNFLVYYEGSDKWGFDRTVGNLGVSFNLEAKLSYKKCVQCLVGTLLQSDLSKNIVICSCKLGSD